MSVMNIQQSIFGKTSSDENVHLFSIQNSRGMGIKISTYGATLTSIVSPDKNGEMADITLGFDNLQQYLDPHPFLGVICGRYANRIAKGLFTINGKEYRLAANNGPNTLHGGITGFDKVLWKGESYLTSNEAGVKLTYVSKDMEEGFPGNLTSEVTYALTNNNEIKISYCAQTDAPTVVNLTNHTYFNLSGCKNTVLDHIALVNAECYTEVDSEAIPTGKNPHVEGSPFDFRKPKSIGEHIEKAGGYDHNFVLNKSSGNILSYAGSVYDPASGRCMDAYTTEPGMQFYTGNFLDGSLKDRNGTALKKHFGFCWETQHYPDSPNQKSFPSTNLNPGERYHQLTVYKFGIKN
jgi:aldose 1-epimerase